MTESLYSMEECERVARRASLRYVKDTMPGITRQKKGDEFIYFRDGKPLSDENVLARIKKLAIPPAYQDVWICPYENGHIQATGRDKNNRKQYRYHPLWFKVRNQQKFTAMIEFGQSLPLIKRHISRELNKPAQLNRAQVICAIIYLLYHFNVRVGNTAYARQNKSYGLTTLRKKHLSLKRNKAILNFRGKNAKLWNIILSDKRIIKILKKCEEISGYELFKYIDKNNSLTIVTSQDVNFYLKSITNYPFTAKDFRTWIACRETLCRLIRCLPCEETSDPFNDTIKQVSKLMGHTPAICQKNYIHPDIILSWKNNNLRDWVDKNRDKIARLTEDKILLLWLKSNKKRTK
ncbi:DNA topoisomerase IB [Legionella sp. MW5194]|uniref:DNA topoisomerase IB n=1 Tax=Legionella sp. MW5194 TaxID=2662448 RepID=UPI00193E8D2B|nr:DNA topoisomerase IB [Legionella sp. MW5194]QRN03838.1 DNA topoisomerase IB [Legionella sp. MW5194]